jgi:hypothetical protein
LRVVGGFCGFDGGFSGDDTCCGKMVRITRGFICMVVVKMRTMLWRDVVGNAED